MIVERWSDNSVNTSALSYHGIAALATEQPWSPAETNQHSDATNPMTVQHQHGWRTPHEPNIGTHRSAHESGGIHLCIFST